MSRGREQDTESDYKPKTVISKPRKSSRARRQIEQVDYSEAEIISDTESETTNSSEGTFMVDSPERGERQVKGETDWELSKVKTYIDMSKAVGKHQFVITGEEWERSNLKKRNVFKQLGEYSGRRTYHQKDFHKQQDSTGQGYKRIACFQSGKLGHVSWECSRARLAGENPKPPPLVANIHTSM